MLVFRRDDMKKVDIKIDKFVDLLNRYAIYGEDGYYDEYDEDEANKVLNYDNNCLKKYFNENKNFNNGFEFNKCYNSYFEKYTNLFSKTNNLLNNDYINVNLPITSLIKFSDDLNYEKKKRFQTLIMSLIDTIAIFDGLDNNINIQIELSKLPSELNHLNELVEDNKIYLSSILDDKTKQDVERIYKNIFDQSYDILSFGVFDVIDKKHFNILSEIAKKLRINGLKNESDYLITIGIKILIDVYLNDYISKKHLLLEKLLNKYFINKTVKVLSQSLIIKNNKDEYIPVDKLSTGEKNLIILLLFTLRNENSLLILDEPDLSMSVNWQSQILVDLLKFTSNRYLILSQSPLLIQKNNLSTFVENMRFDKDEKIVLSEATIVGEIDESSYMKHLDSVLSEFNFDNITEDEDISF